MRTLATNGLGSLYAEEIILRANEFEDIDKNTPAKELNEKEVNSFIQRFQIYL